MAYTLSEPYVFIYLYFYFYTCIHIYMNMYIYIHICIYIYIYICIYIYIYYYYWWWNVNQPAARHEHMKVASFFKYGAWTPHSVAHLWCSSDAATKCLHSQTKQTNATRDMCCLYLFMFFFYCMIFHGGSVVFFCFL